MMPAAMIEATQSPPWSTEGKPISTARAVSGFCRMRTVTSVTTPSRPSEPVIRPEQVVAVGVEMLAAEPDHVAVGQHHLQAEHVVGGEAVFQAVHAARVLGDVAADGAGDLRGGVGGVVEALVLDGLGDAEVGDAGLGGDGAVLEVDVEDAVELAHAQDDAVGERQRPAGQAGPGAARDDLDLLRVAEAQDAATCPVAGRQDHGHRHRAVGGEPVALVGAQLVLGRDHALARHDLAQARDDALALGQHLGVGLGHLHGEAPSRPLRGWDARGTGSTAAVVSTGCHARDIGESCAIE